jgi:tetratricopeptide (TPR) repeat protein
VNPSVLAHFKIASSRNALPAAVVQTGTARFTVLTSRLIRLEYSPSGQFEDRASTVVLNRDLPAVPFEQRETHDSIEIITADLHLRCIKGIPFGLRTLSIHVRSTDHTWHYGDPPTGNLRGTVRTLDQVWQKIPLGEGLISRDGWSLIDDTSSWLLNEDGWIAPRTIDQLDLYFFGYGHDYKACQRDFCGIAGAVPIVPRWTLGNWWSRYWKYTDDDLRALMERFKQEGFPLSVCVIDMDWHITKTVYDFNYLLLWGHFRLMIGLHERLQGRIQDSGRVGRSVGNLGTAYRSVGRVRDAIGCYERALALARSAGERQAEAACLGNLGSAYSDLGQIDRAITYYEQALAIDHEIGDRSGEGSALGNLGSAYSDLGQFERAIGCIEQALEIARATGYRRGELHRLDNLGYAGSFTERRGDSLAHLTGALVIAEDLRDPNLILDVTCDLAEVLMVHGEDAQACARLQAGRTLETTRLQEHAAALHGIALARLGDSDAAQAAFAAALMHADDRLALTPRLYTARFSRALAHAGMALVAAGGAQAAIDDYRAARGLCSAAGVILIALRRLDLLLACPGGERLAAVRRALSGDD